MPEDTRRKSAEERKIENLLQQIHLFKSLDHGAIARVAERLTVHSLKSGERLFAEGDYAEGFFLIMEGSIRITREDGKTEETVATLVAGDYFGETALLNRSSRTASAYAVRATDVLQLNNNDFVRLLREFPKIRKELATIAKGYGLVRQRRFDWLEEGESVHIVARKHGALLVFSLLPPVFLGVAAGTILALGLQIPWLRLLSGSGFVIAILWGIWNWVDWGNDYYIVTDKRVVWLEKVVLLYDSRQEAPLETIEAVNANTTQLQRILGYGDVVVRTITGGITMRNVGQPDQFRAAVEQYWGRVKVYSRQSQAEEMSRVVRERIGLAEKKKAPTKAPPKQVGDERPAGTPKRSLFQQLFGNLLKVRFEEGSVITYRKHWYLLAKKIWPLILLLAVTVSLFGARLAGVVTFLSPRDFGLGFAAIILISFPYWVYHYIDWRDDKYQITARDVIDLDRKPLGKETRKSAPLEKILSIEHERVGIISLLLNFGTVIINIGDEEFDFEGVTNPAAVHQEVFERYFTRKKQLELERAKRERERVLEWIDVYHRNVQGYWIVNENEEDDEFEE